MSRCDGQLQGAAPDRDRARAARERGGEGRQGRAAPARRERRVIQGETLWELVEARAAATPDALFAVDEHERTLTFAGYRERALRVAAAFHARGISAGMDVSWMLPTTLEALVVAGALARLGAVQNPILPIYRERETRFITNQTRARLLCVPPVFRNFDYPALAQTLRAERDAQGGRRSRPTRSEPEASEGGPLHELDVLVVDGALPERDPSAL
ncbi:MAG: hypothetical protein E6J87_20400, partial [Deltaproteobacteria bacterium]